MKLLNFLMLWLVCLPLWAQQNANKLALRYRQGICAYHAGRRNVCFKPPVLAIDIKYQIDGAK